MRGDDTRPEDSRLTVAVQAAQDGDEEAFRGVYRTVHPRLLAYVRTLVGETDAEDVASEAWLQIARDLARFTGDADRFRGWAARIARNRALDHLRMRGRRPVVAGDDSGLIERAGGADTAGEALEALGTSDAMRLIARLPRDQAEAVTLRVVVGLDAKGAAAVLGKRPGAVRTSAHRGLRRLAELIGTEGGTPRADRLGADGPQEVPGAGQGGGDTLPERQAPAGRRGAGRTRTVPAQRRLRPDGTAGSFVPGVTETAARTQKGM